MNAKQESAPKPFAGDSYDLALGLRRRLSERDRPHSESVTSQLQSTARERLESGDATGKRARSRSRSGRGVTTV